MPIHAYLLREHGLLVSQFVGTMNGDDLLAYYHAIHRTSFPFELPSELVDLTRVAEVELHAGHLRRLAMGIEARGRSADQWIRSAVVANTPEAYGFARMFQLGPAPDFVELEVFSEVVSALEWLRLDAGLHELIGELYPGNPSTVVLPPPPSE